MIATFGGLVGWSPPLGAGRRPARYTEPRRRLEILRFQLSGGVARNSKTIRGDRLETLNTVKYYVRLAEMIADSSKSIFFHNAC